MRYVTACNERREHEEAYRIYVTDSFKLLGNLNVRYADIIRPPVEDSRSPEEIIDHIKNKVNNLE